ncbi:MAG: ferrochelatase [Chlorobiaceae bacterium]|nr:ferrochelatase [Chlorobiaceae bacterium]
MAKKRMAVVMAAHGEAETSGFVENYRVSLHTLRRASGIIPVPVPLQHFISFSSSMKKRFSGRTTGSPQNALTRRQASILQKQLDQQVLTSIQGVTFEVMPSFSASEPYIEEVLNKTRGYDGRIVIPMAPVDNAMSCGLLCDHLAAEYTQEELSRIRVVGRLWSDVALYQVFLDHLFARGRKSPSASKEQRVLMLLFHGTLLEDRNGVVPSFRTGHEETLAFSRQLTALIESDGRNPWGTIVTAFLNHDVGGRWSNPSFDDVCRSLAGKGYRQVSLFAAGYFSDGNETVHRVQHLASAYPEMQAETLPCLNDTPAFASCLADRVVVAARQILSFSGESTILAV